jgi:hypothetical protein
MRMTNSISRSSLYFRFFSWAWGIEKERVFYISLCRLFWGTIFFPLAVVGYYISWFAIVWFAISVISLYFSHGIIGGIFFFIGGCTTCCHFYEIVKKTPEQRRKEKQEALVRVEAAAQNPDYQLPAPFFWFINYVVAPIMVLFFWIIVTKPGRLCLAAKRKLCPIFYVK